MKLVTSSARSLAVAWEYAVLLTYSIGDVVETEYGERAKEVSAVIEVREPFSEPRYHLKGLVGDVDSYISEVVEGIHDALAEKYGYTYHHRLTSFHGVDQISHIVEKLKAAPYTRRAVCITWHPATDLTSEHPPCLIYLWFHSPDNHKLVLHAHMRSNDALKAAHMNMLAFTELQRRVAGEAGFEVGEYVHIADSFHIYESDWKHAAAMYAAGEEERRRWRLTTEQYRRLFKRG